MAKTYISQDSYDLLIEFLDWFRNETDTVGDFDYDNNDEIVQRFIDETD